MTRCVEHYGAKTHLNSHGLSAQSHVLLAHGGPCSLSPVVARSIVNITVSPCRPLPEQTRAGANQRPASLPGPMDPLTYLGVAPFLTMQGSREFAASERSAQKHRLDIREVADRCKKRKCESGTDVGQCDQVKKWRAQNAKHALRRAKALQRRLEQGKVQKKSGIGTSGKCCKT